jgi:sigma-B regulation protein RsbU (phosphoserine phosphatase)
MVQKGGKTRLSVRTKIFLVFLILSVTALLLTGFLAFVQMGSVSRFAVDRSTALAGNIMNDSSAALEQDAEDALLRLAKDQAHISDILFRQVSSETTSMAMYAREIQQQDPSVIRERHFYLQDDPPLNNLSTSVLFLSPGVEGHIEMEERNAIGMMDSIFIPIYSSDPHLSAVYLGTRSGMSVIYPWFTGMDAAFDPRTREWFRGAEETGDITWSKPYVDLLGHGLMITCSKPVSDPEKGWFWVVGADITIETINQNIIGTQVGDLGYAMLIDSEGNVLSRPGLSSGDMRWDESFETENLLNSTNPGLRVVAINMTGGNTGVAKVRYENGERFIAYAPVESVNWSVAVVMPVEEVVAPAAATRESILEASIETASHITDQQEQMRAIFSAAFFVMLVMVSILTLLFTRHLTRPIEELRKGSEEIGAGNLDYTVNVQSGDEFEDLAVSFNHMAADLKGHIENLKKTTAEKERIEKELEIAKVIQQSFLPEAAPELPGMELEGFNLPAAEVGGDFYDFIKLEDEQWGLVIADVSGKGVPAALFMALSRTLVRASTSHHQDPAESIREANLNIFLDSKTSMFVTLFYAVLDANRKVLSYVNAGHNPPMLFGSGTSGVTLLEARGIALGVIDTIDLESVAVPLNPGDVVVLYTDGVTEATDDNDQEYGVTRLRDLVMVSRDLPAREIITKIVQDVIRFTGSGPQFDDITLMILKVT